MRQSVLGLGFVALTGCSFVFVSGPPANHRERASVECTSNRALPIVDTVITGLMTANAVSTLLLTDDQWDASFEPTDAPFSRKTGTVLYAAAAIVGGASAVYGFVKTGSCKRAKNEWTVRMQQGQGMQPGVAPQPGTWPPPAGAPTPGTGPQPGTWPPPPAPAPGTGPQPGTPAPSGTGPQPGTWPPPPPGTPAPAPAGPPPPTLPP